MGFRSDIASSHAVHRIYAKPYRWRTTAHGCLSSAERDGPVGTGVGKPTKSTADSAERGDAEVIDGHYNLEGRDKERRERGRDNLNADERNEGQSMGSLLLFRQSLRFS